MMVTIAKRFRFEAAHQLLEMPEGHKCRRMHGHSYEVEVELCGEPDRRTGLFIDYAEIADAWEPVNHALDHRTLNDIPGLAVPTTEILVAWIFNALNQNARIGPYLSAIKVAEGPTTYARMTRADWLHRGPSIDAPSPLERPMHPVLR